MWATQSLLSILRNLLDDIVASKSMCIFKRNLKQNLVNLYNVN